MNIKIFEFNPLGVNTYVLSDETLECVVIDAACYYAKENETLQEYITGHGLIVKHLLNTHLHFDHFLGVKKLTKQFGLQLQCHPDDLFLLDDIGGQMRAFGLQGDNDEFTPDIGSYLYDGDVITFGHQSLEILHTPGHSPGSVVFYNGAEGCLFCGDLLFYASIGRTDLPGGNYEDLLKSIRTKIFMLPDSTEVYTGHGPSTTIGFEKKYNPFVGM